MKQHYFQMSWTTENSLKNNMGKSTVPPEQRYMPEISPHLSLSVPPALYIPATCFCQWEQALYRFIQGLLRLHHFIRLCLRLWQRWWLILDGKLGAIRKGACFVLQLIWFVWVNHHHTAVLQEAFPSWSICASLCNMLSASCSSRVQCLMCFWRDFLKFCLSYGLLCVTDFVNNTSLRSFSGLPSIF